MNGLARSTRIPAVTVEDTVNSDNLLFSQMKMVGRFHTELTFILSMNTP